MLPRQRALALKTLASLRLHGRQYAVAASLYDKALAIERGPLAPDEDAWIRAFGAAVHG